LTQPKLYEHWRLRLFSFGGYGLALAALALVVFGAIECSPAELPKKRNAPKVTTHSLQLTLLRIG